MTSKSISLGLKENWQQFTLLVVVNAFVGAMIGLERTVIPLLAESDFGIVSRSAVLSFLISFGIVKAVSNLFAGRLGDRFGRKPVLLVGWLVAIPVPLLIIFAPTWGWVIFANVLLGINQGLCWSTTVNMKIDLVGPKQRGLAMVYPTLIAAVSDVAHPVWRGSAVGVYRLWRDLGFAAGAILAGLLADLFNIPVAILAIGGLTFMSGLVVATVMYETLPARAAGSKLAKESLEAPRA